MATATAKHTSPLAIIISVGQNMKSRAADVRATKTFENIEDARDKIQHAIDLLDIHADGGLHDAVAVIVDTFNGRPATSGAPT